LNFGKIPIQTQNDAVLSILKEKEEEEEEDQMTRRLDTVHCLLLLPERNCLGTYFAGALNAPNVHQI
jgi:hypothetical protein